MALDETVIDDGEFNMDELMTFNRANSDHDYQVVKSSESKLPGGYVDLPIGINIILLDDLRNSAGGGWMRTVGNRDV